LQFADEFNLIELRLINFYILPYRSLLNNID